MRRSCSDGEARRGTGLLEVLLGVAICAVLAVPLIELVLASNRTGRGARELVRATLLAQDRLDRAVQLDLVGRIRPADGEVGLEVGAAGDSSAFAAFEQTVSARALGTGEVLVRVAVSRPAGSRAGPARRPLVVLERLLVGRVTGGGHLEHRD